MPQVNNASVQGAAVDDLRDISRERLERTFNTNVIAMFNLVQVCLTWSHQLNWVMLVHAWGNPAVDMDRSPTLLLLV
jgi:NAD(P)-dependent dehydrogenase (short-subunit alcohol dehydrogenase family)